MTTSEIKDLVTDIFVQPTVTTKITRIRAFLHQLDDVLMHDEDSGKQLPELIHKFREEFDDIYA